ncbi:MAG TPA: glycosyltransferase family 2 protein [Burkholderiales bacterium]|nr:glycosyltransferase family 2 protein [Burkholderiales bacterium]
MPARTAVILTTYNRPDALAAALEGYLAQENARFELIVADDGSTAETRRVVEEYAARAPFPLTHVWQEDRGFRAGAARNRALARTNADYVIFSDGDCVPPPLFVARHVELAEPGWFLSGNRILLSAAFTKTVLAGRVPIHRWSTAQWLRAWLRRDVNRALPLLKRDARAVFRKRAPDTWEGVKTCNFSAWRSDLVRANGFDERYSGWGLEDSDLVIRLLHAGVKHKSARFAAPVFHLWHPENDRTQLAENRRRLDDIVASQRVAAIEGLDRYS